MPSHEHESTFHPHCCPRCQAGDGVDRRSFLGGVALGGAALSWLSWSQLASAEDQLPRSPSRQPLIVKPILTYDKARHEMLMLGEETSTLKRTRSTPRSAGWNHARACRS